MGKKKKDTFQQIRIEYRPILKDGKSISLFIEKTGSTSKIFQFFQKLVHDGEQHGKKFLRDSISKLPPDFQLLSLETIKLMIEETLIPLLNPKGEYSVLKKEDKYLDVKMWGNSELIKLLWILKLSGSPHVDIVKLKTSGIKKEEKMVRNQLRKFEIV